MAKDSFHLPVYKLCRLSTISVNYRLFPTELIWEGKNKSVFENWKEEIVLKRLFSTVLLSFWKKMAFVNSIVLY